MSDIHPAREGGFGCPPTPHPDQPMRRSPRIGAYDVRTGLLLPPTILRPLGGRLPKHRRNGTRSLRRAQQRQAERDARTAYHREAATLAAAFAEAERMDAERREGGRR